MRVKKLAAGDGIETRCTRCREIMNHTIVAMVGEQVVRVECNTCHGIHNYHREKVAKEAPAGNAVRKKVTAPRRGKKDPGDADREEWASLQSTMEPELAIQYDMNGKYRVKSLIMHSVFGLGMVQTVIPPNKMEVLFRNGKKLLRCG